MLYIKDTCLEKPNRTLVHSESVFHEALAYVLNGETSFHVLRPDGEDYYLTYRENEEIQHTCGTFPDSPLFTENLLFPEYLSYDETARDRLYLGIFDSYTGVYFHELNENPL